MERGLWNEGLSRYFGKVAGVENDEKRRIFWSSKFWEQFVDEATVSGV